MASAATAVPRLRCESTTLMIVDVQERLIPAMHDADSLTRNCATLTTAAAKLGLPIVITEQYPARLGATLPAITEAAGEGGPSPVSKMLFSACTAEVYETLRNLGRPTVLLCGVEAHVCVMQSALDLLEAGYQVFVPFDAIASRQEYNRKVGWERMIGGGAIPTSTESAVFELLREAGTPEFKALLSLIK